MAKAFNQKIKILYLIQMLMQYTDSEHVMNMQEIISWLDEKGIKSERKSIYDDFDTIRQFGIHVRFKKSAPSGYFIESRDLDLPEVQAIAKAILGCSQIEAETAEILIDKLGNNLSVFQREALTAMLEEKKEDTVAGETASADNMVSGETVSVGNEASDETVLTESVIPGEAVSGEAVLAENVVLSDAASADKAELEEIQLLFKEKHMNTIKARFGEEIVIKQHKETIYKTKVMTEVNPQFFGWASSFGMGIKIVKPKAVAEKYRLYLKKLLKQYK